MKAVVSPDICVHVYAQQRERHNSITRIVVLLHPDPELKSVTRFLHFHREKSKFSPSAFAKFNELVPSFFCVGISEVFLLKMTVRLERGTSEKDEKASNKLEKRDGKMTRGLGSRKNVSEHGCYELFVALPFYNRTGHGNNTETVYAFLPLFLCRTITTSIDFSGGSRRIL